MTFHRTRGRAGQALSSMHHIYSGPSQDLYRIVSNCKLSRGFVAGENATDDLTVTSCPQQCYFSITSCFTHLPLDFCWMHLHSCGGEPCASCSTEAFDVMRGPCTNLYPQPFVHTQCAGNKKQFAQFAERSRPFTCSQRGTSSWPNDATERTRSICTA
jgi:hypothetical protein